MASEAIALQFLSDTADCQRSVEKPFGFVCQARTLKGARTPLWVYLIQLQTAI